MAVNVPPTIWTPPFGNGEVSPSTGAFLDTENGLDLITESGLFLVIEDSIFTQIPQTVWSEDDSK